MYPFTLSYAGFWIRIRFSNFSGSGSGFLSLDTDPVFKFLWIRIWFQPPDPGAKKSAERALKVINLKKLKNYD